MAAESGTGLPVSIEAAWGLRGRAGRGPRPGLSLERIVDAAVHVAATEGLAAVSMSRVATELGAATMSLYRYVAAKDELLDLMIDAGFGPPPDVGDPADGWRARLVRWAEAEVAAIRKNPWLAKVSVNGPPLTPNQVGWLEQGLRCLGETNLPIQEKFSVVLMLTTLIRADASLAVDVAEAASRAGTSEGEFMAGYGVTLAKLIDRTRFPELSAAFDAGFFEQPDDQDQELSFALERLLDGVEALIHRREAG